MSVQQVNRTHKADRLDIPVTVVAKKQPATTTVSKEQPQVKPAKILEGCDPVFSPLSSSAQANLPGRCLS
ncbi:hypothetical protein DW352_01875 [Pseudolabrys taiwanensis]|uniref:Uncharacterized protein n=2 Tax=Pseudolabrys taiwanensis TaxID=331696 RepID=A0A345ZR24_9HYPH|nr:hypothetical protein DW352_01875 [Pseudolabrys taiwanensis]